jgi:4-aminobutyrate aminotransferase-like enzyme
MLAKINEFKRSNAMRPIGDVRGLGAMVAFELVRERGGHDPDPEAVKAVLSAGLTEGVILLSCGYYANTIRILAPLTIPEPVLEEGLEKLGTALRIG